MWRTNKNKFSHVFEFVYEYLVFLWKLKHSAGTHAGIEFSIFQTLFHYL